MIFPLPLPPPLFMYYDISMCDLYTVFCDSVGKEKYIDFSLKMFALIL